MKNDNDFFYIFYISDLYDERHMCRIRCDLNEMSCGSAKCPRVTDAESTELFSFAWSVYENSNLSNYHMSLDDLEVVNKNGTVTKILYWNDPGLFMLSTTYCKLSFCNNYGNGSALSRQHDADGKLLLNSNLNLSSYTADVKHAQIFPHNLQESGTIVAIISGVDTVKVLLIFGDGEHALLMDLSHAMYVTNFKLLDGSTELCFEYTHSKSPNLNVTYSVNCVPKKLYNL